VTETTETTPAQPAKRRAPGLSGMLLPELKQLAGGLGIKSAGGMRKSELVEAIKAAQAGRSAGPAEQSGTGASAQRSARNTRQASPDPSRATTAVTGRATTAVTGRDSSSDTGNDTGARSRNESHSRDESNARQDDGRRTEVAERSTDRTTGQSADRSSRHDDGGTQSRDNSQSGQSSQSGQPGQQSDAGNQNRDRNRNNQNQPARSNNRDNNRDTNRDGRDDDQGTRRNRRRRGRDRGTGVTGGGPSGNNRRDRNEPDTTILEDDVLVPVAGILDVLDNYAFVRTSGYLPGPDDVYVSLSMVRKYALRRGDAITGEVRQAREGERREKFNPLVRLDTINGADPEIAKNRVEFQKLTPLYPSERLRLETDSTNLIGRVIDIAAPIGKGQRGLIVSPSKAGKTIIMQSIANSITTNNPECHLMVVLVDERPEEVTDFERSVKGEVISSTFDRPASDHTAVAELAIERAKRLVELGHDVVVLLDGITRLGRAYNLAAPASGRILSGGVDSAALYPPKRFFGAARNIEDGGSLTILATALIESGSKMDEVIFEEFKGTGNMEIRLRRDFADKRLFPAIDAVQSGTRREELLMSKEELSIVWKLRRVLSGLDGQQALELLLERLKKTQSNIEFLTQVQKTTPTSGRDGE
jgi:transcription termination factor Rho